MIPWWLIHNPHLYTSKKDELLVADMSKTLAILYGVAFAIIIASVGIACLMT